MLKRQTDSMDIQNHRDKDRITVTEQKNKLKDLGQSGNIVLIHNEE